MIKFNLAKTMFIIAMSIFCFGILFCGCDSNDINPDKDFNKHFNTMEYYSKTGIHYQLIWNNGFPKDFKIINITEDSLYKTVFH